MRWEWKSDSSYFYALKTHVDSQEYEGKITEFFMNESKNTRKIFSSVFLRLQFPRKFFRSHSLCMFSPPSNNISADDDDEKSMKIPISMWICFLCAAFHLDEDGRNGKKTKNKAHHIVVAS